MAKTVDEELKPETVETSNLRRDIGFLLNDEVEAIDGYDDVLESADLTEEQRDTLQEIRNDELEHVNNLNEIYRTLATGEIEEGNDIAMYNEDSSIRDYKSNELITHIRELYKIIGKDKIDKYREELKKKGGYRDLGTRLVWDILYAATRSKGERISDWYDKYEVNDDHITSAGKKVLKEMGVYVNDSKITDTARVPSQYISELKKYADRFGYDWLEVEDGYNSRVSREGMSPVQAVEDLKETMAAMKSLYDSKITGAGYKEADVNEPINPMCDKVEDGIFESILNAGTNAFRGLSNASEIDSKPEKIKDAETVETAANNSGRIALGNKYHWEKKYADRTLTISKIKKENLKLELNNTTYVIIPIDKFYTMLNMGEITPVSTVDINGYDDVKTTRNYKVSVGDKTYVVNAKSAKDAKFKIKKYRENN